MPFGPHTRLNWKALLPITDLLQSSSKRLPGVEGNALDPGARRCRFKKQLQQSEEYSDHILALLSMQVIAVEVFQENHQETELFERCASRGYRSAWHHFFLTRSFGKLAEIAEFPFPISIQASLFIFIETSKFLILLFLSLFYHLMI